MFVPAKHPSSDGYMHEMSFTKQSFPNMLSWTRIIMKNQLKKPPYWGFPCVNTLSTYLEAFLSVPQQFLNTHFCPLQHPLVMNARTTPPQLHWAILRSLVKKKPNHIHFNKKTTMLEQVQHFSTTSPILARSRCLEQSTQTSRVTLWSPKRPAENIIDSFGRPD